jgi:serine/threonine-protein kinase
MKPANDDPLLGAVLGDRYRILAPIAAGGMGVVYRGERVGLDRPVAVKFLHALIGAHREAVARFEREAKAMSRLTHPHCVAVTDYGVHEGSPYIVMEYVPGPTLAEILRQSEAPLPPARVVAIVRQVLAGLAHAHGQGIVHRDIKPANIVLAEVEGTGDHARILDFGLAKLIAGAQVSWSNSQLAVGTPSYMSPEQVRGEAVDARTDLYSVGVLLHELLTRRKPFLAKDPFEILKLHVTAEPPALGRADGPQFSSALEAVAKKALAKQPEDRWATALELSEALAKAPEASGREEPAPVEIVATKPSRAGDEAARAAPAEASPKRRRGGAGRTALGLALLAAVAASVAWFGWREATERAAVHAVDAAAPADLDATAAPSAAVLPAAPAPDAGAPDSGTPDAAPDDVAPDAAAADAAAADAALLDGAAADDAAPIASDAATADGA